MTDKGYDSPPAAGEHAAHENGAANGHDPDSAWLLLDSGRVPSGDVSGPQPCDWPDGAAAGGEADEEDAGEQEAEPAVNGAGEPAQDAPEAEPLEESGVTAEEADTLEDAAESAAAEDAEPAPVPEFTDEDRRRHMRMGEALLFASAEPLRVEQLAERLPDGADVKGVLADLAEQYRERGVNLVRVAGGWAFRTAPDLAFLMERERVEQRKLSRAALETLAIIAYHQPVTRAEIEDIRGVSVSKGTIDVLMEIGWVRVRGRRQTPGRPVTYGTSDAFLDHFGLDRVSDLPGMDELKAAGLLDSRMPTNISIPRPSDEDGDDELEDEEADSLTGLEEAGEADDAGGPPDELDEQDELDEPEAPAEGGEEGELAAAGSEEPEAAGTEFAEEGADGAEAEECSGVPDEAFDEEAFDGETAEAGPAGEDGECLREVAPEEAFEETTP